MADSRERSCEYELAHYRSRLESQKGHVQYFESAAEEAKASVDESIAKRNALTDDLEKAQAAYDDARKAYEEAKAAADKAASPEITQPTETTPQELKIAANGYCLRQSTTPETKEARFPNPGKRASLTAKSKQQHRRLLNHVAINAQATPASSTKHGIQFCSLRR